MATRVRDRLFAWVGVVVIIVSVGALSTAVIIQNIMTSKSTPPVDTQTSALNCTDSSTSEPTLPVPAKFIVDKPVADLQVTDISQGTGAAAKKGDCLVVKYYGTLAKDGTLFDETYTKPQAFAFTLGNGDVIPGWDQGLAGLKEGGERRLVIPSALAYGPNGQGSIPPNSDLVFYVKLLRIQK